jgi:hypothetical protein
MNHESEDQGRAHFSTPASTEARRYVNLIATSYRERSRGARGLKRSHSPPSVTSWSRAHWAVSSRSWRGLLDLEPARSHGCHSGSMSGQRSRRDRDRVLSSMAAEPNHPDTAGALYGFVLSPCRAVLIVYFAVSAGTGGHSRFSPRYLEARPFPWCFSRRHSCSSATAIATSSGKRMRVASTSDRCLG